MGQAQCEHIRRAQGVDLAFAKDTKLAKLGSGLLEALETKNKAKRGKKSTAACAGRDTCKGADGVGREGVDGGGGKRHLLDQSVLRDLPADYIAVLYSTGGGIEEFITRVEEGEKHRVHALIGRAACAGALELTRLARKLDAKWSEAGAAALRPAFHATVRQLEAEGFLSAGACGGSSDRPIGDVVRHGWMDC